MRVRARVRVGVRARVRMRVVRVSTYAQYCMSLEEQVYPLPPSLDFKQGEGEG